jgi:4-amino-4-deoxy-L-arabinose transferase-like glycosyltransferase
LAVGAVLALAAGLRLWTIHEVPGNVFYDAAVRSMGQSWHAFFFGALEPGGSLAIDKPPVDLWLQVAATKALGFGPLGLHLPEALGGVAACGLLFGALYRPFGFAVALLAALALAVLPAAVLTARSDTMDSLLAALQIAALWLSWRALQTRRLRWSVLAAATLGLAFNVKLAEALIALVPLALLWLWAAPRGARGRAIAATTATFLAVALSWTAIAALTPLGQRPFPVGSANGSIWRVTLVYNGLNRISGNGANGATASAVGGDPGPLRLLSTGAAGFWALIGAALLVTVALGLAALAARRGDWRAGVSAWAARSRDRRPRSGGSPARDGRPSPPPGRPSPPPGRPSPPPGGPPALQAPPSAIDRARARYALALVLWFVLALIVCSGVQRLQTRYLEVLAPALCAVFGLSLGALLRAGDTRRRLLCATAAGGLLIASLNSDAKVIGRAHTDSLLSDASSPALSLYLRAHRDGARYEVASANVNDVTGLVVRDGLPVLVLNDVDGALTRVDALAAHVAAGHVRFYLAPHACHGGPHCPANDVWAYAHSVPVAHLRGLRRFTVGRSVGSPLVVAPARTG